VTAGADAAMSQTARFRSGVDRGRSASLVAMGGIRVHRAPSPGLPRRAGMPAIGVLMDNPRSLQAIADQPHTSSPDPRSVPPRRFLPAPISSRSSLARASALLRSRCGSARGTRQLARKRRRTSLRTRRRPTPRGSLPNQRFCSALSWRIHCTSISRTLGASGAGEWPSSFDR
jgi:hypothetical protein